MPPAVLVAALTLVSMLTPLAVVAARESGQRVLLLVDIDGLGAERLAALRADPRLLRFVELGELAVLEAAPELLGERSLEHRVRGEAVLGPDEVLVVQPRLHCGEGGHEGEAHAADAFGRRGPWHLEIAPRDRVKRESGTFVPGAFERVAWQSSNHPRPKTTVQADLAALADQVDGARWRADLEQLAAFDRQTAAGFGAALGLVESRFAELGLQVSRRCFQHTAPHASDGRACNIEAVKTGSGAGWVIVGAHLDSRNATFNDQQPSPGAEDNASGCAAVMEAARVLASHSTHASLLFQCYGLEELGLHGSRAHAAELAPDSVRAMINLDMIAFDADGRLDLSISSDARGRFMLETLAALAHDYTTLEVELASVTCCSDHVPYLERGIPAVLLIQGDFSQYGPYHTSVDRPAALSTAMATQTTRLAVVAAASHAGPSDPAALASGYWYAPSMSGQGWHFERQADGSAVAAWYTFDTEGRRLWLAANGSIEGDTATLEARSVDGGLFPPAFDPAAVTSTVWGTLRFRFHDCARARIEWQPLAQTGLPAGAVEAVRLTRPSDNACATAGGD